LKKDIVIPAFAGMTGLFLVFFYIRNVIPHLKIRHCERSEAIQGVPMLLWIASLRSQ
jgi:hypothetical protein